MKTRNYWGWLAFVNLSLFLIQFAPAYSNVVVTPATGGNCIQLAPGGAYTVLSNIIVTESNVTDFSVQSGATFILTAPAGFQFKAGTGTTAFLAGRDITSASISVTATTITVTLNVSSNTQLDNFRIRNIAVRATAANASGNILRTLTGGTAIITGDDPGAGVNHGTLYATGAGSTITSAINGVWSNPATWVGGVVPSCTDNIVINNQVNCDVLPDINNLTINTGGNLISDQPVTVNGTFTLAGTGIYTHNNISDPAVTIFKGTEVVAPTSTIIINKWNNYAIPFPTNISGNVGNVTFSTPSAWSQKGLFAPNKIKGTLSVTSGSVTLDDGTAMTTALTLQDVVISGTGRLLVQTGAPRNLTLVTGNFTDNSTTTNYTSIMYRSVGDLNWQVNGDLNISHRFTAVEGLSSADIGSATINVTGNFTIGGGTFECVKKITGSLNMSVAGISHITGSPALVTFKNYYDGDITFNSASLMIDNSNNTYFSGPNGTTGSVDLTIAGNMNVSGATTRLFLASNIANLNDVFVSVGNDLILTDAQLYTTSGGGVVYDIGRDLTQSGATSVFYGQFSTTGSGSVDMTLNGGITMNGGLFVESRTTGSTTLNATETIDIQNATFYGMNNTSAGNNGTASLTCSDLSISASSFALYRGVITDGRTIVVNIANQLTVNFTSAAQSVFFIDRTGTNNAVLDLNIGTNFFVTGSASGLFCSSMSAGAEDVSIGGDLNVSAGRVRFNSYEGAAATGHVVTGTVGGSLLQTGGSIVLSSNKGLASWNITGDYDQTAGYVVCKWFNGSANIDVHGNYNLKNANMILYSRATTVTVDPITFTVYGNATFENSVVMFDSCLTSTATHKLILKGNNVTFNDNAVFNHKAHLSNKTIFGSIIYDKTGTITVRRNSSSFDMRQVKQSVTAGTTVDFSTSPYDMMIASHLSASSVVHTSLTIDGTLNMGDKMIVARNQGNYYSSVSVNSTGRLITAHANGLYSGSVAGSCIYPVIGINNRMNYYLDPQSTVEYNGTNNQIVSGTGIGIATTVNHRYGNLEINFQGTPDVEYAYPIGDSVQVRSSLILTKGELNLDTDHITNGGGHTIQLLNGSAISRSNGYIRSETEDGTAAIKWNITTTGSFVVPFGYNSTEYIPFTYQATTANSGDVLLATYHVIANNTPYPPTVSHVRDFTGVDNSLNTVDRFWRIQATGNPTANLTFSFTTAEGSGIANPRAQLWEPVSMGWFPPTAVQSNPTANTTLANTINTLNTWWTLSSASNPLPVELLSFNAYAESKFVKLDWKTASEVNNDYFTVEKSIDGNTYIPVTNVDGAGTSSATHNYSAYDYSPVKGISYYRLKQTDFDGNFTFSEVKKVNFTKTDKVVVYPNPLTGSEITINTENEKEVVADVTVYDLAGKLVLKIDNNVSGANSSITRLDIGNSLVNGAYLVEVKTNDGIYRERLIRQ